MTSGHLLVNMNKTGIESIYYLFSNLFNVINMLLIHQKQNERPNVRRTFCNVNLTKKLG